MGVTTTSSGGRYAPLTAEQLADAMRALPAWRVEDGRLVRTVEVNDVWPLLERVSAVEGELDHHSVVALDGGRLVFSVWTHVRPALTAADVVLAQRLDDLLR